MLLLLPSLMFALWTTVFSFAKLTLQECSPIFLTAARMLLSGAILIGYILLRKPQELKTPKKQILPLILLAIFSIYLTNICEFWGIKHMPAAKGCFIYSLSPFFAAFFSYLHFQEKMTIKKWIGLSIGLLGFIPAFLYQSSAETSLRSFLVISWPEIALIGAALFSVYGWVLLRLLVKDDTISPIKANGISMLIGGFMALVHSFFTDSWQPFPISQNGAMTFIGGLLTMTLISNIICYNLYGYFLKKFTATLMSFLGLLSPFFSSLTAWLILGEKPSLSILASTCIVIAGLWIVYKEELKQGYIDKKTVQQA